MDYLKTKNQLIEAYQNLLEVQYYDKKNARKHIKVLCDSLLANMILFRIQEECLNLDLAVGVQLDVIGKWIGITRFWGGSGVTGDYFAYYEWDHIPNEHQGGLYNWDNNVEYPFLNYDDVVSTTNRLNDDDFRTLIKLKIIKNNTNMTCYNIDNAIYKLFEGQVITIWGDCLELTYKYPKILSNFMSLAKEKNVLPRPTGVNVILEEI